MAVVDEIYVLLEESKKMTAIDDEASCMHLVHIFSLVTH